jgi:hypothetical protein
MKQYGDLAEAKYLPVPLDFDMHENELKKKIKKSKKSRQTAILHMRIGIQTAYLLINLCGRTK